MGWDDFGGDNDFGLDDCVFFDDPICVLVGQLYFEVWVPIVRSNPRVAVLFLAHSTRAELPVVAATVAAIAVVCLTALLLLCAALPVVAAAHAYDDGHHERGDGDGKRETRHDDEVERRRRVDNGVGWNVRAGRFSGARCRPACRGISRSFGRDRGRDAGRC